MEQLPHEQSFDNKIGVIDLETYTIENSGKQAVYAGGWAVGQDKHLYYLGEPKCENKYALIKTMITDIFESGYGNYTFYAHNFARFDDHFITNYLLQHLPNY